MIFSVISPHQNAVCSVRKAEYFIEREYSLQIFIEPCYYNWNILKGPSNFDSNFVIKFLSGEIISFFFKSLKALPALFNGRSMAELP